MKTARAQVWGPALYLYLLEKETNYGLDSGQRDSINAVKYDRIN